MIFEMVVWVWVCVLSDFEVECGRVVLFGIVQIVLFLFVDGLVYVVFNFDLYSGVYVMLWGIVGS